MRSFRRCLLSKFLSFDTRTPAARRDAPAAGAIAMSPADKPDLILVNGRFTTLDPQQPQAEPWLSAAASLWPWAASRTSCPLVIIP